MAVLGQPGQKVHDTLSQIKKAGCASAIWAMQHL
jgi:hypothetical protein